MKKIIMPSLVIFLMFILFCVMSDDGKQDPTPTPLPTPIPTPTPPPPTPTPTPTPPPPTPTPAPTETPTCEDIWGASNPCCQDPEECGQSQTDLCTFCCSTELGYTGYEFTACVDCCATGGILSCIGTVFNWDDIL